MPFTVSAKNAMLNALTYGFGSLHTDFPGQIGSNEVTGGSYARQALTVGTASGEQRVMTGAMSFPVPATTVRWVGFWDAGSNFLGYSANGGSPLEFVVDTSSNLIISPAHLLTNGTKVVFYDGTAPAPLVQGTIYFVITATANTFQVSATSGGSALVLTTPGTSECQCSAIVEDVFAAPGTETVSAASFALNL